LGGIAATPEITDIRTKGTAPPTNGVGPMRARATTFDSSCHQFPCLARATNGEPNMLFFQGTRKLRRVVVPPNGQIVTVRDHAKRGNPKE